MGRVLDPRVIFWIVLSFFENVLLGVSFYLIG